MPHRLNDSAKRSLLAVTSSITCRCCVDGRELDPVVTQAAQLLATVVGQDLDQDGEDGVFRVARRVAADRVISTVDTETRHGRKTSANGFDGYKGHLAIDPDSEIICSTRVSAGNTGDAASAGDLLADDLEPTTSSEAKNGAEDGAEDGAVDGAVDETGADAGGPLTVYGDAAYGAGELLAEFEGADATVMCKVQPSSAPACRFSKDCFDIDQALNPTSRPPGRVPGARRPPFDTSHLRARPQPDRLRGNSQRWRPQGRHRQ